MDTGLPDFLGGVPERHDRFRALFDAATRLGEVINALLDHHEDLMEFRRDDSTRHLGLIVVASFGKALKTFQAIGRLAVFGYGEDALVLVRANVNLLINGQVSEPLGQRTHDPKGVVSRLMWKIGNGVLPAPERNRG